MNNGQKVIYFFIRVANVNYSSLRKRNVLFIATNWKFHVIGKKKEKNDWKHRSNRTRWFVHKIKYLTFQQVSFQLGLERVFFRWIFFTLCWCRCLDYYGNGMFPLLSNALNGNWTSTVQIQINSCFKQPISAFISLSFDHSDSIRIIWIWYAECLFIFSIKICLQRFSTFRWSKTTLQQSFYWFIWVICLQLAESIVISENYGLYNEYGIIVSNFRIESN